MGLRTISIFFLGIGFFFLPSLSQAQVFVDQSNNPTDLSQTISFTIDPTTPAPNTTTNISIESSSIDLDSSTISWSVNGKTTKNGRGLKNIDFVTGQNGSLTTITVYINSVIGQFSKTITIRPGTVDLLWQGGGYVPPFYKGRTLWAKQGMITLVAIPNIINSSGNKINSSNLIYRWTQDGTILGTASGAGKSSLTFYDSVLSLPTQIQVEVLTDQDTVAASTAINLAPIQPNALVYEDSPLYGTLFNSEVKNKFNLKEKEVSFVAFPLFFSVTNKDSSRIKYTWFNNGTASGQNSKITYRITDQTVGSSNISLRTENTIKFNQTTSKDFMVNFNNQNNL